MIRTSYDPEADVFSVNFGPAGARSDGSQEVAPGVFVEFDTDGEPIGIEVISVERRASQSLPARERLASLGSLRPVGGFIAGVVPDAAALGNEVEEAKQEAERQVVRGVWGPVEQAGRLLREADKTTRRQMENQRKSEKPTAKP